MEGRYFYPFILMTIAWLVPDLMLLFRRLDTVRSYFRIFCIAPTLALIILLWTNKPPIVIQQFLGYNLSTGGYQEEVTTARKLITASRSSGKPIVIYANAGIREGIIHAVDYLDVVNTGHPFAFEWIRPLDWVREPGVRLADVLKADWIIVERTTELATLPHLSRIETYDQELGAFQSWIQTLNAAGGVESLGRAQLVVVNVVDKEKRPNRGSS
jgi:hypothetical protein